MFYKNYTKRGFSIIELIVVMGVVAVLSTISFSAYRVMQTRNDTAVAVQSVAHALRHAQVLSRAIESDSGWGVNMETGSVTVFKGSDYANRDSNFDKVFNTPQRVMYSGLTEIIFLKFSGTPQNVGAISLINENETKEITINEKGMVSY